MNITEEELLCFEAECIATLRGAAFLRKPLGEILDFNFPDTFMYQPWI